MPEPQPRDAAVWGKPAIETFEEKKLTKVSSTWMNASLEEVKKAMALTGYPIDKMHFIKGLVEDTIPQKRPGKIALLRLDTDWYSSTKHELNHLYPLVSLNGIVILDDYGHFKGAKEAVDEYFSENKMSPFLHRIDYTGRLIIKN